MASTDYPLLELSDRAELRAWLEANHAASGPVHLAVTNKGGTLTELTYEDAIEEALAFGWIDSTSHALDGQRHTVMFGRRRPGGTWARSNKERVARLSAEGRMAPAGLAAIDAAKADGSWTRLDDIEALMVPADLAAALAAEPGATEGFTARPASERKIALFRISEAKRTETRMKRVSEVVRAAAEGRRLY